MKAGRPSRVNEKDLGSFLRSNYPSCSYEDLKRLSPSNPIIKHCSLALFGEDDKNNCKAITTLIRRNSRNFSSYLESPRICILQNFLIKDGKDFCYPISSTPITKQNMNEDEAKNGPSDLSELSKIYKTDKQIDVSVNKDQSDILDSVITPDNKSFSVTSIEHNSTSNDFIPDSLLRLSEIDIKRDRVLPENSRNMKTPNWPVPSYRDCRFVEGSFIITSIEMGDILSSGQLVDNYVYLLTRKTFLSVNNVCVINFRSKRYSKHKDNFRIYAYCAHNCKKFIYVIDNISSTSDHKVTIFSSSLEYNHLTRVTRYLKGVERKIAKRSLKSSKPSKYRTSTVLKAAPKIITEGNLQNIKSDSVIRNVRSEQMAKNDRDKDDLIDLILMQRINTAYIKEVGQPFHVYMFSKQQLEIVARCGKDGNRPLLHLDATGNVVRRPKFVDKRVFYYAGVIRTEFNDRIVPIMELISCRHDAVSIGVWLAKFRYFSETKSKKWPIFSGIVTDFSSALINAVMFYINKMYLEDYLKFTYEIVMKDINTHVSSKHFQKITPVYICCSHFFKIIVEDIKKASFDDSVMKHIKEIMAAPFNLTNMSSLIKWFENLVILLCSPEECPRVNKAMEELLVVCVNEVDHEEDFKHIETPEESRPRDPIYKTSPFYRFFVMMYDTIIEKIKQSNASRKKNKYFNENFVQEILKKYIPYLPLWTSLISGKRRSNAPVENWFSVVKHLILEELENQKTSRVIRLLRKRILAVHKEITLGVPKTGCTSRRKIRRVGRKVPRILSQPDSTNELQRTYVEVMSTEEQWKKKFKSKSNNFTGTKLKRLLKKIRLEKPCKAERKKKQKNATKTKSESSISGMEMSLPQLYFYDNGLVSNSNYYRECAEYGNYIVVIYKSGIFSELKFDDFKTLYDKQWLSDVAVTHSLQAVIKESITEHDYQLINTNQSYAIFYHCEDIVGEFFEGFPVITNNSIFVLPVIIGTVASRNHWVLVIVNFMKASFTYIDPRGESCSITEKFKRTFERFIDRYNFFRGTKLQTKLTIEEVSHIRQNDGYNCGVYIIYFTWATINKVNLLKYTNIDLYRSDVRKKLLKTTDILQNNFCLICGAETKKSIVRCKSCSRSFHTSCTSLENKCQLCKMFFSKL